VNYLKFDLGMLNHGRTAEITLIGDAANVRLIDEGNLYNYVRGREYVFLGGLAKKSPVMIKIPKYAHWFIIIDMEGLTGTTDASVKIV